MTTSKNEEEILDAFTESGEFYVMPHRKFRRVTGITSEGTAYDGMAFDIRGYLRSALASYLMHLKGEMPEKTNKTHVSWIGNTPEDTYLHGREVGHNSALDQVHALLDEKIHKLTE